MKKTQLEQKLEAQELLRLDMLAQTTDASERKKLLDEISALNEMRDGLEGHRLDGRNNLLRVAVQAGVPALTVVVLSIFGFASEQINGNPTGFTLKWLFNRAPR